MSSVVVEVAQNTVGVAVAQNTVELNVTSQAVQVLTSTTGPQGANGIGVPVGGTAGQVLAKTSGADYATGWVTSSGGGSAYSWGHRAYKTGQYYTLPSAVAGASVAVNTIVFMPFVMPITQTMTSLTVRVSSIVAGATASLGIYSSNSDDVPTTLVLDAGAVSTSTTGAKTITISQSLSAGLYWLAYLSTSGAPQIFTATTQSPFIPTTLASTACWIVSSTSSFPSTVTPTLSNYYVPLLVAGF